MLLSILISNLVLAVISYVTGHIISFFCLDASSNPYLVALEKFFFGLLAIIVFFAVYITGFKTVMICVIPVLIYLFATRTQKRSLGFSRGEVVPLLLGLLSLLIFIGIQFIRNDFFDPGQIVFSLDDYGYYGDTAAKMIVYGLEGKDFNEINGVIDAGSRLPYHYFDLWVNGFIQTVLNMSKLHAYLYVFTPIAMMLVQLSIMAVLNGYLKKIYLLFIASFLLVFLMGAAPFKGIVFPNALLQVRTFFTYILLAIFICYYRDGRYARACAVVCMAAIFNILSAPPVFSACFLTGVYLYWQKRKQAGIHFMLISVLVCVSIVAFYTFLGSFDNVVNREMSLSSYIMSVLQVLFRDTLMRVWYFYLPVLFTIILLFKTFRTFIVKEIDLLVPLFLFCGLSIFFSALLYFNIDGSSIGLFPAPAAICFLVILWIAYALKSEVVKGTKKMLVLAVMLLLLINNIVFCFRIDNTYAYYRVSKEFIESIDQYVKPRDKISYIYSRAKLNSNPWTYNSFVCHGLHFPFLINKELSLISSSEPIGLEGIEKKTSMPPQIIEMGAFYKYAQDKKSQSLFEIRKSFFKDYHIKYVILDRSMEHPEIYDAITERKIKDPSSGYSFLVLKETF